MLGRGGQTSDFDQLWRKFHFPDDKIDENVLNSTTEYVCLRNPKCCGDTNCYILTNVRLDQITLHYETFPVVGWSA